MMATSTWLAEALISINNTRVLSDQRAITLPYVQSPIFQLRFRVSERVMSVVVEPRCKRVPVPPEAKLAFARL